MSSIDDFMQETSGFKPHSYTTGKDGSVTSTRYVQKGEAYTPLPGTTVRARSTLIGPDGDVRQEWIKERVEDAERDSALMAAAGALMSDMRPVPVIERQNVPFYSGLMVGVPVGDHHMGMLAWKYEVAESYDLDIGEDLLAKASEHLMATVPVAGTCLVAFLGDFAHYDSWVAQTPSHNNPLDADGRYPKMVRASVRAMMHTVNVALRVHRKVHVIVEIGNHDPALTIAFMEMLRLAYSENERVTIDTAPSHYHYFRFGNTLIGTHHGDKVPAKKVDALPLIMASDRAKEWGETKYHTWWTGHIHQKSVYDYTGCTVESFRILPPNDGWAHAQGYRSRRGMEAIVYHEEYGETGRYSFNPEMLK